MRRRLEPQADATACRRLPDAVSNFALLTAALSSACSDPHGQTLWQQI